jgi:hypothetical protein
MARGVPLLVVMASTASAHAGSEPGPCTRAPVVLPAPGPPGAPRNVALCEVRDVPARSRLGADTILLLQLVALVAVLCVAGTRRWFGRAARSPSGGRSAVGAPISLLVAERLAHGARRRAGAIAVLGVIGVPALVVVDLAPLAMASAVVGCGGLHRLYVARAVLQLIEWPGSLATAEAVDAMVIVRGASQEVRLEVAPKALAAARRHAVPTSVAGRT